MTEAQSLFEVKSVKLVRKDQEGKEFTPEIVLWDPILKRNDTVNNCQNLAHPDLVKAVAKLADHMVVLWDADIPDNFEESKVVEHFEARGYSIKGGGDETRVTIKGHRKTKFAGAITANATILLEQDMDDPESYPYSDAMKERIKKINIEVLAFVFDKKYYENPQLSLDMPDGDEKITRAKIAAPVTPESIVKDLVDTTNGTPPVTREKGQRGRPKKRVPQSSDNPSGIIEE